MMMILLFLLIFNISLIICESAFVSVTLLEDGLHGVVNVDAAIRRHETKVAIPNVLSLSYDNSGRGVEIVSDNSVARRRLYVRACTGYQQPRGYTKSRGIGQIGVDFGQ